MAYNPRLHSVKLGTRTIDDPNFPINKIERYMDGRQDLLGRYDYGNKDKKQILNSELLQIISTGINNIVDQLKIKLGDNFTESNQSAKAIGDRLNILKNVIDIDIRNDLSSPDEQIISINPDNKYEVVVGDGFLRPPLVDETQINVNEIESAQNFNKLMDPHQTILKGNRQTRLYGTEENVDQPTLDRIENKLKNCQNLEFLYLKKHDEIMKIFSFTINLFDKYKYAIKIVLLLLKSLVYKDPEREPPPIPFNLKVKVPIDIIPNIRKLVIDQKKIQSVIDKMKTVITPDVEPVTDQDEGTSKLEKLSAKDNVPEIRMDRQLETDPEIVVPVPPPLPP